MTCKCRERSWWKN